VRGDKLRRESFEGAEEDVAVKWSSPELDCEFLVKSRFSALEAWSNQGQFGSSVVRSHVAEKRHLGELTQKDLPSEKT
jgi:hypothetical protein